MGKMPLIKETRRSDRSIADHLDSSHCRSQSKLDLNTPNLTLALTERECGGALTTRHARIACHRYPK
jgi:hypothetical protein